MQTNITYFIKSIIIVFQVRLPMKKHLNGFNTNTLKYHELYLFFRVERERE